MTDPRYTAQTHAAACALYRFPQIPPGAHRDRRWEQLQRRALRAAGLDRLRE